MVCFLFVFVKYQIMTQCVGGIHSLKWVVFEVMLLIPSLLSENHRIFIYFFLILSVFPFSVIIIVCVFVCVQVVRAKERLDEELSIQTQQEKPQNTET